MKLADWLNTPNPDGTRKERGKFAANVGVTPQMISAYCKEENPTIPKPATQKAIARETGYQVLPNDWIAMETTP